jgi:uncharacterized membrane protein
MRVIGIGQLLFALSVMGLGLLSLGSGDFALNWQPVPPWVPAREILAYASGAILLVGGLAILVRPSACLAALVLTINFAAWLVLLQIPRVAAGWSHAASWLGFGETSVLVSGAWAILATLKSQDDPAHGARDARLARILFGIATPLIGLSHFVYLKETVAFVPSYLPVPAGLAYFTGAAHIAAGLAVLFSRLPRLAAGLEAVMMGLFALMVWAPRVVVHLTGRFEWTALLISVALSAGAAAIAQTYGERPLLSQG